MFVQRKLDMDICLLVLILPLNFFKEKNRLGQTQISFVAEIYSFPHSGVQMDAETTLVYC